MTDQQNPFSTMPEPPAAPDPAQAFDNAQGQAAQSYDADQTAQQAYDPYQAQAQQPYGAGQGYDPYQAQQTYQQPYQATYEQPQPAYQQVYAQPVAPAPGGVHLLHPVAGGLVLAHHPAGVDDPHVGHLLGHLQGHQGQHRRLRRMHSHLLLARGRHLAAVLEQGSVRRSLQSLSVRKLVSLGALAFCAHNFVAHDFARAQLRGLQTAWSRDFENASSPNT